MKHFLSFRGGKIAYQTKGKGEAVVLLHGFLANSALWKDITPRLSKHYRLFIIDLPGHGASSTYGYLHKMEFVAEIVLAILKTHGIRKTFLVGHSLGGYVALAFAEKNPDMIKGILLINSTAKGDSVKRKHSREQLKKLLYLDREKAIGHLVPTFFRVKSRKRQYYLKRYLNMAKSCDLGGISANIEGMKNRKEREIVLKFAPYPFAYLIGEKDNILKAEDLIEESKLSTKGSALIIEEGSHMLPLEATEKTLSSIRLFLTQLRI